MVCVCVLKLAAQGKKPPFIHSKIVGARQRRGADPLDITTIRRFIRGRTHRRGCVETRGRKRSRTRANVLHANKVRKDKIKKHHPKYVKWDKVVNSSRAPQVHRTNAKRSFKRVRIKLTFRHWREKLQLTAEHEQERETIYDVLRKKPVEYFEDEVDMILDCKMFATPTTQEGRDYVQPRRKTRDLRAPEEGLQPEMTKPNQKRHLKYVGGYAHVPAGVSQSLRQTCIADQSFPL